MKKFDFVAMLLLLAIVLFLSYFAFPASAATVQHSTAAQKCDAVVKFADVVYDFRQEGFSKQEVMAIEKKSRTDLSEPMAGLYTSVINFAYQGAVTDRAWKTERLRSVCLTSLQK